MRHTGSTVVYRKKARFASNERATEMITNDNSLGHHIHHHATLVLKAVLLVGRTKK